MANDEMNEKSTNLVYTKAFKDDECIAYAWDRTKPKDGLMASAKLTVYGGSVDFLGDVVSTFLPVLPIGQHNF